VTLHYPKDNENQIGTNVTRFILFIDVILLHAGDVTFEVTWSCLYFLKFSGAATKLAESKNLLNMPNLFITF
jgi:hypothetical protein